MLANVTARSEQLAAALAERVAPLDRVREVRQRGLMTGIELAPPDGRAALGPAGLGGAAWSVAC